jgi:hypothetical protein
MEAVKEHEKKKVSTDLLLPKVRKTLDTTFRLKLADVSVNSALRIKGMSPPVWQCLSGGAIAPRSL